MASRTHLWTSQILTSGLARGSDVHCAKREFNLPIPIASSRNLSQNSCLLAIADSPRKQISRGLVSQSAWTISWLGETAGLRSEGNGILHAIAPRLRQKCQSFQIDSCRTSIDDEFRSPRGIAQGLHRRYRDVVDGGYSRNLKEFVRAGVTAYALGCTEEGIRKELLQLQKDEAGAPEPVRPPLGSIASVTLTRAITSEDVEECLLWVSIVFVTVMTTPEGTVLRWSTNVAVSSEALLQWRGFCTLISNAYYTKGMAWFSVRRLQLEQLAVVGKAEDSALVSDRMRLIFTTLEVVDPRWGGLQDFPTL